MASCKEKKRPCRLLPLSQRNFTKKVLSRNRLTCMQSGTAGDSQDDEDDAPSVSLIERRAGNIVLRANRSWPGQMPQRMAFMAIVAVAFCYVSVTSFLYKDPANASQCRMAWMSPGYIRMEDFDRSHSRLASKYSLWLYREQGWDLSSKVCHSCSLYQST